MCPFCRVKFNGYSKDGKKTAPAEPPAYKRLQALVDKLIALHKMTFEDGKLNGQEWRADVERLAAGLAFTSEQLSLIADKATPTLKPIFAEAANPAKLGNALTHSFQDSLVKILSVLSFRTMNEMQDVEEDDRKVLLGYGAALQACLSDIVHNYRLILPPKTGEQNEYTRVLALYEEKLVPQLERINEQLPQELGFTSEAAQEIRAGFLKDWTAGKEHLNRIPAAQWQPTAK